ncbi:MAG: AsmA family protein [Pseudomonadales bacterium]|nr:AsmA family protein [Pseudomonadales bacterium]
MSLPRLIKFPLLLLALLLALLLLAAIAVTTLVDPNQFKPLLADQVKQATSLELQVDGDLGWQFFPKLGISIGQTELHTGKSYDGDTLFAKLGAFNVGVGWRGLIRGQLQADRLTIDGLQLRLVTDKRNHSNWKDVEAAAPAKAKEAPAAKQPSRSEPSLSFELAQLTLHNIDVSLVDLLLGSRQNFIIDSLTAEQLNLEGRPFPLRTSMQLASNDAGQSRKLDLRLSSAVTVDSAAEIYALKDIDGQLDKSRFSGELNIRFGKHTAFVGELAIDKLNIDDYLDDTATSADSSAATGDEPLPFDVLKTLHTQLEISIGQLIAEGAVLDQVRMAADIKSGILNIRQLRANVFAGEVDLALQLNSNSKPATLTLQQSLENVAIEEVLANRDIAVNLSGKTTIKSDLAMRGNSINAWLGSVGGSTRFAFDEGRYGDDNIEYRVCQAIALARKTGLNDSWTMGTNFKSVNANIEWQSGIGRVTQFTAGLENLGLSGDGSLSLLDKKFDIRVVANLTGDLSGKDPACAINEKYRDIRWPLRCRGTADSSSCGVDNSRLDKILTRAVKDRAKQEVREKVTEKLEEKLGKGVSDALKGLFR